MNSVSAPRDDFGLIELQAHRARRGLIPRAAAVRQYPSADANIRPDPLRWPRVARLPASPGFATQVWLGRERRRRRIAVLLDTRARAGGAIDLMV